MGTSKKKLTSSDKLGAQREKTSRRYEHDADDDASIISSITNSVNRGDLGWLTNRDSRDIPELIAN